MTTVAPCYPQTLAEHGNLRVDLCGCGCVHVTIGSLSLRLARPQYLALCDTLLAATRRLPDAAAGALH